MPEFSMVDSIRFGWSALWPNRVILAKVIATFIGIMLLRGLLTVASLHNPFLLMIVALAALCAEIIVGVGFINITLRIVDGKPAEYRDIMLPFETLVRYVAANLLVGILVVVGLILFVIPGIYAMVRFSMVRYAALEGEGDAFSMLSRSTQLTDGVKWRLLGFILAIILINIVGAAVFFVGLLVTIPLSTIAMAHLYRELTRRVEVAA